MPLMAWHAVLGGDLDRDAQVQGPHGNSGEPGMSTCRHPDGDRKTKLQVHGAVRTGLDGSEAMVQAGW